MKEEIRYELAETQDTPGLVDCVQRNFPTREPMAIALDLSPADYLSYSRLVCEKAIQDRLTWVAKSTATGSILGFCINEDYQSAPDYSASALNPKILPILALLEDLDRQYLSPNNARKGDIFHLYMLAVDAEYAGTRIGTTLLRKSLNLAKGLGYQRAAAEATGPASQSLCRKLGFLERGSVAYADYRYDGRCLFAEVEGVTHCWLFEGRLDRLD